MNVNVSEYIEPENEVNNAVLASLLAAHPSPTGASSFSHSHILQQMDNCIASYVTTITNMNTVQYVMHKPCRPFWCALTY